MAITGQADSFTMASISSQGVGHVVSDSHERDVGLNALGQVSDLVRPDLTRDHLVAERGNERCNHGQALLPFVGDQDTEMLGRAFHDHARATRRARSIVRLAGSRREHGVT